MLVSKGVNSIDPSSHSPLQKKNYTDDLTILFSRKRQREREIYRYNFTAQSSRLDPSCKIYSSQFFFSFLFLIVSHSILGDPGDVSRVGRKGATMVFKHGLKTTKNPQNIVSTNRRTASPEFFQCARTQRLLPRHTFAVRSPKSEMQAVPKRSV